MDDGMMLTHVMDSTTERSVGQFTVQVFQIGQDAATPIQVLSIHGEMTEDIAAQVFFVSS